ncbi:MAG: flagellar type III secretion system pore protein FliP [Desulfococcaceae bacterium]|jgi:flagellar biosynthetic protein FliP|nr:flagellar type III secretion system pore protein FliP [Desulfococcaceae bacterium]
MKKILLISIITLFFMFQGLMPRISCAASPFLSLPRLTVDLDKSGEPQEITVVMEIFLLLTVLSLAPAILIMLTPFTRIVIVLSVLRQAIGTQQMPPNQVIIGMSLFLTLFVMNPVLEKMNTQALQPYMEKKLVLEQALKAAFSPLRQFMCSQTREKDIALFVKIAKLPKPKNITELPATVLIPSFLISELKTAFQIAFLLYIPFLIIDMVVASVLLSMGMMMLPPVMISLPFKIMLFVLSDGWNLIVGSLIKSFGGQLG